MYTNIIIKDSLSVIKDRHEFWTAIIGQIENLICYYILFLYVLSVRPYNQFLTLQIAISQSFLKLGT